jgi:hypothetical protein
VEIPVLIEPVAGNGYRASGAAPFAISVEGATRGEALEKLRRVIQARVAAGVECVSLQVPINDNPWLRLEGVYKDDPRFAEWQQAIAEYRQQVDADPNAR